MGLAAQKYRTVSRELMRDELIVRHLDYVRHILARMVVSLPDGIDAENLESAGVLGLVEAAQQFDPTRGVPFKTFAFPRIRGAIIDELRRNCPLPQQMLQAIAQVRRACESLEPPVTPEAIAQATTLSPEQVEECLAAIRLTRFGVWDEMVHGGQVSRERTEDDPGTNAERHESKQVLAECIQRLPEQERLVVTLYYLEDMRLKEIGMVLGLSESRISRVLAKAEHRLKEYVRARTQ
ncbi:MAG: sigma-70 family RNA polymerase sigma factor [Planctomycetales bacterium]|nr:sigma-70 family RNA polymerase sigma factor [Planctomycetales bacterium]